MELACQKDIFIMNFHIRANKNLLRRQVNNIWRKVTAHDKATGKFNAYPHREAVSKENGVCYTSSYGCIVENTSSKYMQGVELTYNAHIYI